MKGTLIWHPVVRDDERGFFAELWKSGDGDKKFGQIEQINMSRSKKGVLRGMHLQHTEPMGKVMTVISGKAILAAVCCNPEDERFKEVIQLEVSADKPTMFYADAGWARGFLALEDNTSVVYACTGRYSGGGELAVLGHGDGEVPSARRHRLDSSEPLAQRLRTRVGALLRGRSWILR